MKRAGAVRVRPYESQDESACVDVFRSNVPEFFSSSEEEGFRGFLRTLPGPYFALVSGDRIVGCGGYAVGPEPGRAALCWGMIARDCHSQGLGSMLVYTRPAHVIARPDVQVATIETSQHTVGFYERHGFEVETIERDGFAPGIDRIVMKRSVVE